MLSTLSAPALLSAAACWQLAAAADATKPPAFLLAGDSMTAVQTAGGGGYGTGFLSFLKSPAWGIDYGQNGATTVSYREGGSMGNWTILMSALKGAVNEYQVYVPIMFGANDQKEAKGITLDMYQTNLQNMAGEVKEAGGIPILLTPMTRRKFRDEHTLKQDLINERTYTDYAAGNTSTMVIDFNLASENFLEAVGETTARTYDLDSDDQTHLNSWGSVVFGRIFADLLLGHEPTVGADQVGFVPDPTAYFTQYIGTNDTLSDAIWGGVAP